MKQPQKLNRTEQRTRRFLNDFSSVSKYAVYDIDPFVGTGTTTVGGNIIRGVICILEAP